MNLRVFLYMSWGDWGPRLRRSGLNVPTGEADATPSTMQAPFLYLPDLGPSLEVSQAMYIWHLEI